NVPGNKFLHCRSIPSVPKTLLGFLSEPKILLVLVAARHRLCLVGPCRGALPVVPADARTPQLAWPCDFQQGSERYCQFSSSLLRRSAAVTASITVPANPRECRTCIPSIVVPLGLHMRVMKSLGESSEPSRSARAPFTTCMLPASDRSEEHTCELQSRENLVCR